MNANPLLYEAVWGIEITESGTRLLKIGDGTHYWQTLPYVDATSIKGLPEKLAELAAQGDSLADSVQGLQEALAQETAARIKGDDTLHAYINAQMQNEAALRAGADNNLRLSMEALIQIERSARESLQVLVGQLLEFIREQLGPFESVALITDNGFNVATHNGKTVVTLLDINHII
jgi:aldehyde:ferredoxin oxidoreductase